MENASKALLLGAGILIGLIVISIGVYLFASYRGSVTPYEQHMQETEIKKFNVNFTKFEGRDDITIQEIVTLINFAKQYEQENEVHITIAVAAIPDVINWLNTVVTINSEDKEVELIQDNSEKIFKCENIIYNNEGKVNLIKFIEKI